MNENNYYYLGKITRKFSFKGELIIFLDTDTPSHYYGLKKIFLKVNNSYLPYFISKISNAKPKVADYPFTTLEPNLGIVRFHEFKSFVVADIPGLIEGASSGKGLGLKFLKHIERTKILVYMIDVNTEDIDEEYKVLKGELKKYNADLVDKPSILLLTKCDIEEENKSTLSLKSDIKFIKISSLKNINLDQAIYMMSEQLELNW